MQYYISKKSSLWRDSFIIKNYSGIEKYAAKAKSGFSGNMELMDSTGQVKALIKSMFNLLVPKYSIWIDNHKVTDITKKISINADYKFSDLQWEVLGDMRGFSYRVTKGDQVVFCMNRESNVWGSKFIMDIEMEENELLSICVAIALIKGMKAIKKD